MINSEKKYFPIKTETACKLKWSWSTIRLYNGITSSCHRVWGDQVDVETFNFHNTPHQIKGRELMLEGKWPTGGCEYCRDIEQAGGTSDRQFQLKVPNGYPAELEFDQTLTNVNPTILEIYLDNVCNLSCLYCYDGFSSKIQQENIKFGVFNKKGVVIQNTAIKHPQHEQLKEKFWEWMDAHSETLEVINLLGGEPLYQKEFGRFIELLENKNHPKLDFTVFSNLMIDPDRLKSFISRIKKVVAKKQIKKFSVTASIDCLGAEQEYVRYGLDLSQWKTNFETLVNERWINLRINQTLSGLTIKTVPKLIEYINQFDNRNIGQYMSLAIMTRDCLSPHIFGKDFFADDFEKILSLMKEDTWQQQQAKINLKGIIKKLSLAERNQDEINKLGVYLNEIDRRRQLNWKQTFPWLEKEIQNVVS